MRKFFSGLMVLSILLSGAVMMVRAGSEGKEVVGGTHTTVTFQMDTWFVLWAEAIKGWKIKTASVSSSSSWTEPVINDYVSSTSLSTVGPEAFSATLSGDLIPPGGGGGSGPVDYSVKGDLNGTLTVDPAEAQIGKGKTAEFSAMIDSSSANASWAITPLEGGSGVTSPGQNKTVTIGADYRPGRYQVQAKANNQTADATLTVVGLEITGDDIILEGATMNIDATATPDIDISGLTWSSSKGGAFSPESGASTAWSPEAGYISSAMNDVVFTATLDNDITGTYKGTVASLYSISGRGVTSTVETPGAGQTAIVPVSNSAFTITAHMKPSDSVKNSIDEEPSWFPSGHSGWTEAFTPDTAGEYTVAASLAGRTVAMKIIVRSSGLVNISAESVSEDDETSIGAFVRANDNDDNNDNNVDSYLNYDQKSGDNDLLTVSLSCTLDTEVNEDHPVILSIGGVGFYGMMRVWDNKDRSGTPLLTDGGMVKYDSIGDVPTEVYVEGISPCVFGLSLSYSHPGIGGEVKDTLKITVAKVNITLDGVSDEKTIRDPDDSDTILRVEPYELTTGGYLQVNSANMNYGLKRMYLHVLGSDLPESSTVKLEWTSDKMEIYSSPAEVNTGSANPVDISTVSGLQKLSSGCTFALSELENLYLYVNPTAESAAERDIEIKASYTTTQGNVITVEDVIKVTNYILDINVDSDNNAGNRPDWVPDLADRQAKHKSGGTGKIVPVDQNDADNDGIPDYADLTVLNTSSFVPVVLQIPSYIQDLSKINITISYPGLENLPDATAFAGADVTFDSTVYKNYSAAKTGYMRIWAKIENAEAERKTADIANNGNYVKPDTVYTADKFISSGRTILLFAEGVNPTSSTAGITVTVDYQKTEDKTERIGTDSTKVSVPGGTVGVNTTNDTDFNINGDDHKIKDQKDGFVFWASDDTSDNITETCITDLFPFSFSVPQALIDNNWKFYLTARVVSGSGDGFYLYKNKSSANSALEYITDPTTGSQQITATKIMKVAAVEHNVYPAVNPTDSSTQNYLLKALGTGVYEILLHAEAPNTDKKIILDSCKVTVKDVRKMYWMGTARKTEKNTSMAYPIDKGYAVNLSIYDAVDKLSESDYSEPNTNKSKYLIFLHGYNESESSAITTNKEMFKRTYWTGFRGNYIGITWNGDSAAPLFSPNVYNAFRTAPVIMNFLNNKVKGEWGANVSNINIMAHSMGNLLLWETLRLQRTLNGSTKIVNNVVNIEAAIWEDAFLPEASVAYTDPDDPPVTYGVDMLTKSSWAFWLRQKDTNQNDLDIKSVVNGSICNSYSNDDYALVYWMKLYGLRFPGTYDRTGVLSYPDYRTPYFLAYTIPPLVKHGQRTYPIISASQISDPQGLKVNNYLGTGDNINAKGTGTEVWNKGWWRAGYHSDMVDLPIYNVYLWYNEISTYIK